MQVHLLEAKPEHLKTIWAKPDLPSYCKQNIEFQGDFPKSVR